MVGAGEGGASGAAAVLRAQRLDGDVKRLQAELERKTRQVRGQLTNRTRPRSPINPHMLSVQHLALQSSPGLWLQVIHTCSFTDDISPPFRSPPLPAWLQVAEMHLKLGQAESRIVRMGDDLRRSTAAFAAVATQSGAEEGGGDYSYEDGSDDGGSGFGASASGGGRGEGGKGGGPGSPTRSSTPAAAARRGALALMMGGNDAKVGGDCLGGGIMGQGSAWGTSLLRLLTLQSPHWQAEWL